MYKDYLKYLAWRISNPVLKCAICQIPSVKLICSHCYLELDIIPEANCCYCAKPISQTENCCLDCQIKQPFFNKVYTRFNYSYPLAKILQQLKYQNNLNYVWQLGYLLYQSLKMVSSDTHYIIPMPSSKKSLNKRGFNHIELLLKYYRTRFNSLKIKPKLAKKVIDTPYQASMNVKARMTTANPFIITRKLTNKNILIVDDVLTTGNTAKHLAQALKLAGANRIEVCVLMRATIKSYKA